MSAVDSINIRIDILYVLGKRIIKLTDSGCSKGINLASGAKGAIALKVAMQLVGIQSLTKFVIGQYKMVHTDAAISGFYNGTCCTSRHLFLGFTVG